MWEAARYLLAAPELGVEYVPEGVSQQVESEHHHENSQTGEDGDPRRRRAVLFLPDQREGIDGFGAAAYTRYRENL